VAAVVGVLALGAGTVGCGSGAEPPPAQRSARRWADTLCTELARWVDGDGGPEATLRLRARVLALEPADADDGLAAQGEAERLVEAIPLGLRGAPLDDLRADVRGAVERFRGLTPGGAVEQALAHRRACERLRRP
jgi:hypothetical protein